MMGGASILAFLAVLSSAAQTPPPSPAIAAALLPLPEPLRAGAMVVQLDAEFRPVVLRKGTNGMVCIADRSNDDRFDVRCYKDTFIPVVYRAFQLGYQVSGEKVEAEIKAGRLPLPSRVGELETPMAPTKRRVEFSGMCIVRAAGDRFVEGATVERVTERLAGVASSHSRSS
jgi:hypothetical protein